MNIPKIIKGNIYNLMFRFVKDPCKVLIVNDGALGDFIHGVPFYDALIDAHYDVTIISDKNYDSVFGYKISDDYSLINDKSFKMIFLMNEYNHNYSYFFKNVFDFNARRSLLKGIGVWREKHWADFYLLWAEDFLKQKIKFKKQLPSSKQDVVFHAGSSNIDKNWPLKNFIKVYKATICENKYFIIGPQDEYLIEELEENKCKYVISESIDDLIRIASRTALFVGNDSGVGHIFSLFDTKILSIFTIGCGLTHFPYNKNALFYFNYHVFSTYMKTKEILDIELSADRVISTLSLYLEDKDVYFFNFWNSADKAQHL